MLKNYLTVALRTLRKHLGYTLINVLGLAVGMACCLLLGLYVHDERSFDRFHDRADRIYRVVDGMRFGEVFLLSAITPSAWAPAIAANLPEVVAAARVRKQPRVNPLVRYQDRAFYEHRVITADSNLFEVLPFAFVQGDPRTALSGPDGVVITAATAQKYFGTANPMGQPLIFGERTYQVTGVLENPPPTSSIVFDFLLPLEVAEPNDVWTHCFLRLREQAAAAEVEEKLALFIKAHFAQAPYVPRQAMAPQLQALTDIHLHSNLQFELGPNSSSIYVYMLSVIAVFIMGIASINFMNLTTARSAQRVREVGLRKVLGARRGQLVRQFLGESILLSMIAFLFAIGLACMSLPGFNRVAGKSIAFHPSGEFFGMLAGGALLVGLLSGSYPALHLSSFEPARVLKGTLGGRKGHLRFNFLDARHLRSGLLLLQFAVAMIMMIGTGIVKGQLTFVRTKVLGFDKEQVLVVPVRSDAIRLKHDPFKSELLQHPDILSASFAQSLPGHVEQMASLVYRTEGREETKIIRTFAVEHDFIPTLGMDLAAGRGFIQARPTDSSAFVLNEAAVRALGWRAPLGKRMAEVNFGWDGEVIGVVRDFHFASLQQQIEPVVLTVVPPMWFNVLAVRVRPAKVQGALDFLEKHWRDYAPGYPFEYSFLDQDFDSLYRAEQRLAQVFSSASALALFIACLGLFGLVAFTTEQRRKEIGIRKVLGASVAEIVGLLTKDVLKLILIAFAAAAPIAFLVMRRWLADFAYHIEVGPEPFGVAGLIALMVTVLTIGFHAVRAARADPVKGLRAE